MSASDEQAPDQAPDLGPVPGSAPPLRPERDANLSALSWLGRWLGIPFLLIVALYYAEPLFRSVGGPEFVQTVSHQEVYPYPEGSKGPSLAPTDVVRPKPLPFPAFPGQPAPAKPDASEIVAHPVSQPQPVYPRRALDMEREGSVRVRITIAPDGSVSDAVVIWADPVGWFENATLEAVRKWRYQPPGRPLVTEAVIEFRMN
ncbi:MAG: energy transducer TonB [Micropepsaceae bacterium]